MTTRALLTVSCAFVLSFFFFFLNVHQLFFTLKLVLFLWLEFFLNHLYHYFVYFHLYTVYSMLSLKVLQLKHHHYNSICAIRVWHLCRTILYEFLWITNYVVSLTSSTGSKTSMLRESKSLPSLQSVCVCLFLCAYRKVCRNNGHTHKLLFRVSVHRT